MDSAGLWMLAAVAAVMLATGLASWIVLVAVAGMFALAGANAVLTRRRDHFPSPARAQAWFEWRRHGRSLPALVGLVLPFELWLLWLAKDAPAFVFEVLFLALITPPFMAAFTAWMTASVEASARLVTGI